MSSLAILVTRAAAVAAALAVVPACREAPAPGGAPSAAAPAQPGAKRYTVRGEIVRLPSGPGGDLSVRHEAIPDFEDRSGAAVGMRAMVMPFRVGDGVSLDGLEPGDRIRFRFSVDWTANRMEIESVEALPRDTPLEFGGGAR